MNFQGPDLSIQKTSDGFVYLFLVTFTLDSSQLVLSTKIGDERQSFLLVDFQSGLDRFQVVIRTRQKLCRPALITHAFNGRRVKMPVINPAAILATVAAGNALDEYFAVHINVYSNLDGTAKQT